MDHHYVPQFYLRQWAGADGKVWRYRREPSGVIFERAVAPRSTAFEPDLYAAPDVGGLSNHDPHIIETEFFGKIDNDATCVLPKLLGSQLVRLTDDDRTAWALFMNFLFERSPARLGPRDDAAPALAAQVHEHLRSRYPLAEDRARIDRFLAGLDTVQMGRNSGREFMVKEVRNPKAVESLKGLTWLVDPRDAATPLLTTDRPAGIGDPFIDMLTMRSRLRGCCSPIRARFPSTTTYGEP